MSYYIGLDVSLKETSICVVNDQAEIVARMTTLTDPKDIAQAILPFQNVALIGLESGGNCHWLTAELRRLITTTSVICVDALHLSSFLNASLNKTDKHDAEGIAHALRCKRYKEVTIKSEEQLSKRSLLTARNGVVRAHRSLENVLRGTVKTMGFVLPLGTGIEFYNAVDNILTELPEIAKFAVQKLLRSINQLEQSIAEYDEVVVELGKSDERAQLLQQIPGVGPITALSFLVDLGDPHRFKSAASVAAYFGLTSRRYASGETDIDRGISKRGPKGTRTLLVTAAKAMLRTKSWCSIKAWGVGKQAKKPYKTVVTAMARQIAETMYCMLMTGEDFRYTDKPKEAKERVTKKKRARPATRTSTRVRRAKFEQKDNTTLPLQHDKCEPRHVD